MRKRRARWRSALCAMLRVMAQRRVPLRYADDLQHAPLHAFISYIMFFTRPFFHSKICFATIIRALLLYALADYYYFTPCHAIPPASSI